MRKNFRSDISIREIFYDIDQTGERVQSMVPENVRVEYFTPAFPRVRFVCSRNGGIFHNCSLDDNGRTLVCNLPLSRKSLGVGPLLKIVKFSVSDESFPYDLRNRECIASTGIDLWGGPSDAGELESESVLSEVILRYGYSAYRLAVLDGFEGTEEEWLASLIGPQGLSAYQVAVAEGFEGSVSDWLASLTGPQGDSAYLVAVDEGFVGTKAQWLASLIGPQGKSAYQVAVDNGFVGTEEQWLASLHGEDGYSPYVGENGNWFEWDDDEEAYVDSGKPSRGPEGPRGPVVSAEDTGEAVQPINLSPNVQYVVQDLTAEQKVQARENIGAGTSNFSGNYNDLTHKPQPVELSGNIVADKSSTTKGPTMKAFYDDVHPAMEYSVPAGGMRPNVFYDLGVITGNLTINLAAPEDASVLNHYFFVFRTGDTAPNITWPSSIIGWINGGVPEIQALAHYEISIINGYAAFLYV